MKNNIHYYMSDVHYYLGSWTAPVDCHVYACGGLFYPVPGEYILPCREGKYSVVPGADYAMVYMTTQRSGNTYTHPLVHVD